VVWNNANGDTAAFGGTAGTVAVASGGVSAGGIEFDTASYSLAGVGITLTSNNNSGWLGGEVRVNSTADAISAPLAGSVGLTKTGSGTLTLTGASTYSGTTAIQNGTLAIATASDRLPTGTTLILGGSTTSGVLQLGDGATGYNQTVAELDDTGWGGEVAGGGSNVATLTVALVVQPDRDYQS
jgi:fibronectin-binding autotransporter adhesin